MKKPRDSESESVKRCSSCILPHTTHNLDFNDKGECNICHWYNNLDNEEKCKISCSLEDIEIIIGKMKLRGRSNDYDCIMGLSGGRDSSYILYELVKKHGLRVLAAYYRTPFTHEVIDANVKRMTKLLGVKLVHMGISAIQHQRTARKFLISWKKSPRSELANLTCTYCKFVSREIFRIANEYHISTIVWGDNNLENFQFGSIQILNRKDEDSISSQVLKAIKTLAKGISLLFSTPSIITTLPQATAASLLYLVPHSIYLRLRYPHIYRVNYFRHKRWNESDCLAALSSMGWELPPGCNSYWKADCDFAEIKNIMFKKTAGVTYADALFSNMVRLGYISREEAIARDETEGKTSQVRLKRALNTLGLPEDFFET